MARHPVPAVPGDVTDHRCAIHPDRDATHSVVLWGPHPQRRWTAKPTTHHLCAECAADPEWLAYCVALDIDPDGR